MRHISPSQYMGGVNHTHNSTIELHSTEPFPELHAVDAHVEGIDGLLQVRNRQKIRR